MRQLPPERRRTTRLGEVLNRLMKRANLKQNQLARRAHVSPATITNLIRGTDARGKPMLPTPDLLKSIAWGLAENGLGERNTEAADRAYGKLMTAIGYLDAPSLTYAPPLPPEVLDILAAHPELTISIARTADRWSPEATKMLTDAIADYDAKIVQRDDTDDDTFEECVE